LFGGKQYLRFEWRVRGKPPFVADHRLWVRLPAATSSIGEEDIRRETQGTYLGDFDVRVQQKNCAAWPRAAVARNILAPVRSDAPALLIAGEEDPATPPHLAAHAAEGLSHSRVVAIPHGTHLTGAACIDNMIVQFIQAASTEGIDVSCVGQIRNPPFLTLDQAEKMGAQAGR
jgi:pimeloyl-ACP methyl ester carboxylesterase